MVSLLAVTVGCSMWKVKAAPLGMDDAVSVC